MVHSADVEFRKYIIKAKAYENSEYISEAGSRAFESARVTILFLSQTPIFRQRYRGSSSTDHIKRTGGSRGPAGFLLRGCFAALGFLFAAGGVEDVRDTDTHEIEPNHGNGEEDLAHPIGWCEDCGGDEHAEHRVGGSLP